MADQLWLMTRIQEEDVIDVAVCLSVCLSVCLCGCVLSNFFQIATRTLSV